MLAPPSDVFAVDLGAGPLVVSDGVPGPGAGKLETKASKDVYSFTVPAGGSRTVMDVGSGVSGYYLAWSVQDEQGQVVRAGTYYNGGAGARFDQVLPAGNYQLVVSPEYERAGTYRLNLYFPPAEQVFAVDVSGPSPVAVSKGKPGPGAGNLETALSKDVYSFTAGEGDELYVDFNSADAASVLKWQLIDGGGKVVDQNTLNKDYRVKGLKAGEYRWVVLFGPDQPGVPDGTYDVSLVLSPSDVFAVDLGAGPLVVSDGVPGPGAGKLETKASKDVYSFTVPAGGSRTVMDVGSGVSGYYLAWSVQDEQGQVVRAGTYYNGGAGARFDQVLPAGNYQLVVSPEYERAGTYRLNLYFPPAEQV